MGASSYEVYVKGANPTICFDKAVQDALHESGHGGYTGTIGEKRGFRKVDTRPLPMAAARELANTLCNADDSEATDKWGPANAIPVAPDSAFRTKHKMLYLNVREEGHLDAVKLAQERMRTATISGVEVLQDTRRTKIEQGRQVKRVTQYVVQDRFGHVVGKDAKLPAAKALAKCLAAEDASGAPAEYRVSGVITDEAGGCLAVYRQKQISRKVKLRVTHVEQTRRDPAPIGWLFFGYASY